MNEKRQEIIGIYKRYKKHMRKKELRNIKKERNRKRWVMPNSA
jgi:hypothetical protein